MLVPQLPASVFLSFRTEGKASRERNTHEWELVNPVMLNGLAKGLRKLTRLYL